MKKNVFIIILLIVIACLGVELYNRPQSNNEINVITNIPTDNTSISMNIEIDSIPDKLQVINNGGSFVKYGNDIYYWKINESSRTKGALYANYTYNTNNNELIKRSSDGKESVILNDYGYGKLFILNDKIFVQNGIIYSVDLNGKNKKEFGEGIIKFVLDDEIYCQSSKNIFTINSITGDTKVLKENAGLLGNLKNKIYYINTTSDSDNTGDILREQNIELGYIENEKDFGIISSISRTEFQSIDEYTPIEISDFWTDNNMINMYICYRAGTAHVVQEEFYVTLNPDGTNKKLEVVEFSNADTPNEEYVNQNIISENNGEYFKGDKKLFSKSAILKEYGLSEDNGKFIKLVSADIINNEIYSIIDSSIYSAEDSLGWRDGYKREKTICFSYNLISKTFNKLYEF